MEVFLIDRSDHRFNDLIAFEAREFQDSWTKASWEGIDFSRHFLFLIEDQEVIKGFCLWSVDAPSYFAHLLKIVIAKDARRTGLGEFLFTSSLGQLARLGIKDLYLEVRQSNAQAISFYHKFKFQQIHEKKSFYADGETALIMQRLL